MTRECLPDSTLHQILTDDLSVADLQQAIRHLDECEHCRERLDELSGSDACPEQLSALSQATPLPAHLSRTLSDLGKRNVNRQHTAAAALETLSSSDDSLPGMFREFEILDVAGMGGMGAVFKARDTQLDRLVAVKTMNLPKTEDFRSRFAREARAAAAVIHDNVVTIHTAGEHRGTPYLVMQYVEGQSLDEMIQQTGPLTTAQFLKIAQQITSGLRAVHKQGLVHRDLKPANVLVDRTGKAMLTDFGLVRCAEGDGLTATGTLLGTPAYMSPEQAREADVDTLSDLFSLGATFYSMVTGVVPFDGPSTLDVLNAVCEQEPIAIRELNIDVPTWIADLIQKLMKKEPQQRIQSTTEVLECLKTRAKENAVLESSPALDRRTLLVATGSLAAISAILLGPFWWQPQGDFAIPRRGAHFADLAAAVSAADEGDTIQILGNGPYLTEPIDFGERSIAIQAGPDVSPVLQAAVPDAPLFKTEGSLRLAGIEISNVHPSTTLEGEWNGSSDSLIVVLPSGKLEVAFCRFRLGTNRQCLYHQGKSARFQYSVIDGPNALWTLWDSQPGSKLILQHNVAHTKVGFAVRADGNSADADQNAAHLTITQNVLQLENTVVWITGMAASWTHALHANINHNLVTSPSLVTLRPILMSTPAARTVRASASRWFGKSTEWTDFANLYVGTQSFLQVGKHTLLAESINAWFGYCQQSERPTRTLQSRIVSTKLLEEAINQGFGASLDAADVGPGQPFHEWEQPSEFRNL